MTPPITFCSLKRDFGSPSWRLGYKIYLIGLQAQPQPWPFLVNRSMACAPWYHQKKRKWDASEQNKTWKAKKLKRQVIDPFTWARKVNPIHQPPCTPLSYDEKKKKKWMQLGGWHSYKNLQFWGLFSLWF